MGRSAGAGSPNTFRCTRCKRGDWRDYNRGLDYEPTGKSRPAPVRKHVARGVRNSNTAYEYLCHSCGHLGWSTHNDVERRFRYIRGS